MPNHTRPLDRPWPGERLAGEVAARPPGGKPQDGARDAARASAERLFGAGRAATATSPRQVEVRLRSSLGGAPSEANEDELKARREAYERTLWQAHRGLVLRLDDPDLNGTHRLMIEALAKARGFV